MSKRILFITSNRLGDAVLTTGILHHLIDENPDCQVTVVCGAIPASLFEAIPEVVKVITLKKRKYNLHWWDAYKKLDHFYWNMIVDFRGSPLSILPCGKRYFYTTKSDDEPKTLSNAKLLGLTEPVPPKIKVDGDLVAIEGADRFLAIAPTANHPLKMWDIENYRDLALSLTEENGLLAGAGILVLGAPGEEAQVLPLIEQLPKERTFNFVGKTNPLEAAALLSKAELFVGNDSGLMHTALAVDIPTVGLFGIGKPKVYGPIGPKSLCLTGTPAGQDITRLKSVSANGIETISEALPLNYVLEQVTSFYKNLQIE